MRILLMIALCTVSATTMTLAAGQGAALAALVPAPPEQPPAAQPAPPAPPPQAAPASRAPVPATAAPVAPQAPAPASASARQSAGRPTMNVRFDVTITDAGGGKPATKTLSLTIMPGNTSASIRASAKPSEMPTPFPAADGKPSFVLAQSPVALNVDIRGVSWVEDNAVRATVTVEYQPYAPEARVQPGTVTATATSAFYDGRRTQILSTADPISDRKTTIDVTATILK